MLQLPYNPSRWCGQTPRRAVLHLYVWVNYRVDYITLLYVCLCMYDAVDGEGSIENDLELPPTLHLSVLSMSSKGRGKEGEIRGRDVERGSVSDR